MADKPSQGFQSQVPEDLRTRRIVSVVSIAVLLVVYGLIAYFVGLPLVKEFSDSPETFRDFVSSHGFIGPFTMIGIIVLQMLTLIPGEPFELGAGFVFGWLEGLVLCLTGTAIAATIIFLLVKKWGIKIAEAIFPREKLMKFSFLRNEKKLNLLVFILFLVPGTPKSMITYLIGLTPMKLSTFLIITTIARIPSVLSSTIPGSLAQDGNLLAALITYGIAAVVSGVCILWYKKVSKESNQTENEIHE